MKNLLLVGASGFLGKHLKNFYVNEGWRVYTLGRDRNSDYHLDTNNLDALLSLDLGIKIDRVIHAAAINEVDINKSIVNTYQVNVVLTRYLMELSNKHTISEFVYISTFHVYGNIENVISANSTCQPKNDYGLTHYLSENIVENLGLAYGMNTLIVRPTNIYGCPDNISEFNRWSLVPFAFVKSAIQDKSIVINSSGIQLRNFVSVEDVFKTTLLINKHKVINAFGSDTLSIREFAQLVAEHVNKYLGYSVEVHWNEQELEKHPDKFIFSKVEDYNPQQKISEYINDFIELINE